MYCVQRGGGGAIGGGVQEVQCLYITFRYYKCNHSIVFNSILKYIRIINNKIRKYIYIYIDPLFIKISIIILDI